MKFYYFEFNLSRTHIQTSNAQRAMSSEGLPDTSNAQRAMSSEGLPDNQLSAFCLIQDR
jgi:hypothetical protein